MKLKRETIFIIIVSLFVATYVATNVVAPKLVNVFGLTLSISAFTYALLFPLTDLLSECWGKERARRVVIIGFIAMAIALIIFWIAVQIPPAESWENQEAFAITLGAIPRILLAGLAAYIVSQLHDVWAFHFWRKKTKDKHLWLRNTASTGTSQLIDSIIFIGLAFGGTVPFATLLTIMFGQYVVKLGIAVIDTPFVYLGRKWIGVPKELIEKHR